MVNSIKTLEEINTLRNWFKCHNDKSYDFHLLYFDLGINTCYTIDELQNLKWSELLNNDGTVVDSIMYNGSSIRLLGITPKACYTLARIGSRSRRTSKVHSA